MNNGRSSLSDDDVKIIRRELRESDRSMASIAFDVVGLNSVWPVRTLNKREQIRVYFDLPNTRKWHVNNQT